MSDILPVAHVFSFRTIHISLDPAQMYRDNDPTKSVANLLSSKLNPHGMTTLELDSHADTCVLGQDCLIILDYDQPVQEVVGYDPALGTKTYKTVSGIVAYDDPTTGEVFHLVINQAIHIPHLDHHLLCPMQCRVNDVTINETPKFLDIDTTNKSHAIIKDPGQKTAF